MKGVSEKMGRYGMPKLGYIRINEPTGRRRFKLGSTNNKPKRKRVWRFKVKPKLRFLIKKLSTPKKWLLWLRDAYVNMMLRLADSQAMRVYGGAIDVRVDSFGRGSLKEYDEKMLVEFYYKSLVLAQNRSMMASNEVPNMVGIGSLPLVPCKLAAISE